jgi:hypothetical protein
MNKVGHTGARTTIAKTLKDNGIAPSPDRPASWRTFLKSHADVIAAADFFTVDVWTKRGLVTHYVLFVIHHATRTIKQPERRSKVWRYPLQYRCRTGTC